MHHSLKSDTKGMSEIKIVKLWSRSNAQKLFCQTGFNGCLDYCLLPGFYLCCPLFTIVIHCNKNVKQICTKWFLDLSTMWYLCNIWSALRGSALWAGFFCIIFDSRINVHFYFTVSWWYFSFGDRIYFSSNSTRMIYVTG